MVKRLLLLLLLLSAATGTYAQTSAIRTLYTKVTKTHKDTFESKADSMTNAFVESFMIKDKGIFNDKYGHYQYNIYWQQAHAIDVIIYNYERHKSIDYSTSLRGTTTRATTIPVQAHRTALTACSRTPLPTICAG